MAFASKNIVAKLNKRVKLNSENYEIRSMKLQYVLEEQETLEALNTSTEEHENGNTVQHRRDRAAYETWKKKNSTACITLFISMDDDIMRDYIRYEIVKDMWSALVVKFGGTSITKLRSLTIKLDTYKKQPNYTMRQHLRQMSNMINELRDAGHVLTDEQQAQVVIQSLPHGWEHMKIHLTHNHVIKTLQDVVRHLGLEEDRISANNKANTDVYITESNSQCGK
ncbi:uncharacterized protein LOC116109196 [Pistacia vera]|uniref:uncharacterized protein LOC116109196 n=1 Tax=Pistacia vera TaxID=55513 RepID=UPI001262E341|nr:uncharacterized protein LOC116109196 [Pistacia vera]